MNYCKAEKKYLKDKQIQIQKYIGTKHFDIWTDPFVYPLQCLIFNASLHFAPTDLILYSFALLFFEVNN